jgi:stage II sporulation protein D
MGRIARRTLWTGLATLSLVLTLAAPIAADSSATLVTGLAISGHGFGHGIGLSQWGSEARAAAGQTHQEILSFYYPGTKLGTAPGRKVRVLLAERPRVIFGSAAAFTVVDAAGRTVAFAAGHYPVSLDGRIGARSLTLPVTVEPGTRPVMLGGSRYHGTLTITAEGDSLEAVNRLDLEQYVADVVSFENPAYWPAEALRAQAIASRSYALANLKQDSDFDLYPDDRSQNYTGLRKEYPTAVAAVAATRGQVLRYDGKIANALFSASNGGITSTPDGVWGGPALPYFAVRVDRFDTGGPASSWGPVRIAMTDLRAAFPQLPAGVVRIGVATNPADRATSLTFTGADGTTVDLAGPAFQQKLGLRSTYLSLVPTY